MQGMANDPVKFQLGGGATWLNLIGTLGRSFGAQPVERIATPERLAEWLAVVELAPKKAPDASDLDAIRGLRETLRELALAHTAGTTPPADAVAALQRHLVPDFPMTLTISGGRLACAPPSDTREALQRIAREAAQQLAGPERHHLRECAEHDCRWVFSDPTGRRRWCPSPACASRGRVRAYRARQRAT